MSVINKILGKLGLIETPHSKLQAYHKSMGLPVGSHNSQLDALTPSLIKIGKNFVSAPGSKIVSHDSSLILSHGLLRFGKVVIGDNVFLGANSVILAGTIIGDNCIIGAGAVVKGTFEANSVIAGNPAKRIMSSNELLEKTKVGTDYIKIPDHLMARMKVGKLTFEERAELEFIVIEKISKG